MDAACAYGIRDLNTVTCEKHIPCAINKNQQKTRKTGNLLYVWPENQHQFGLSTGLLLIQGTARSSFKSFKAEHSTSATIISHKLSKFEVFFNLHTTNVSGQLTT